MVSIELLGAAHGDSILIEYGTQAPQHRILIDGGPANTYESGLRARIDRLPIDQRTLELMVVTHIDADHIDGALILLQELPTFKLSIEEMWFNGWPQLPRPERDSYQPEQGEFLDSLITLDDSLKDNWNRSLLNNRAEVLEDKPLPKIALKGGALLTLLGPTTKALKRLRARWDSAIRAFSPGDVEEARRRLAERREYQPPAMPAVFAAPQYGDDRSPANGSSIAFVFEFGGISLLLAADAHARTLADSLKKLATDRRATKLHFDAVKVPHHGSMSNVSDDWLQWVECDRWLFSTNGAVFGHPDVATAQLIARHCKKKPTMMCNYHSPSTERLANVPDSDWLTTFGTVDGLRLEWPSSATSRHPNKAATRREPGRHRGGQAKSTGKMRKSRGEA